jgi:hypothetical protein
MKTLKITTALLIGFFLNSSARAGITGQFSAAAVPDSLIMKLAEMKTDTLDSTADIYWQIVLKGKEYIPKLIDCFADTTPTNIYHGCKGGTLTIGELCFFALDEIADFPAARVMRMQYCVIEMKEDYPCFGWYYNVFDTENKAEFQKKVKLFYEKNEFEFKKLPEKHLTDCQKSLGITGKYYLKD